MKDKSGREEARRYFKDKGLSYNDITEGDICVLTMLLNKHVKKANKDGKMSTTSMRMSEKIKVKCDTQGRIKECYLYINSHYFTRRECISFNPNGFIGFGGWADDWNVAPMISAFIEWCDTIAE